MEKSKMRKYSDVDNEDDDEDPIYYCWECEKEIVEEYGGICEDCILAEREINRRNKRDGFIYERDED